MKAYILLPLVVALGCAPPHMTPTPPIPINTADLAIADDRAADSILVELKTLDPSFMVEMRYATANNFTGAVLPGYNANRAYMRREPARALAAVQRQLATRGLGLKIFDAYRPVRATEEMVRWTERVNRPDLITNGYIASRSRHNLGVAVDLTLVNLSTGHELEMGTSFDTFSAAAHTVNATGDAAANRQLLKSAMQAGGFAPYSEEWWHFSFPVEKPLRFDRIIR